MAQCRARGGCLPELYVSVVSGWKHPADAQGKLARPAIARILAGLSGSIIMQNRTFNPSSAFRRCLLVCAGAVLVAGAPVRADEKGDARTPEAEFARLTDEILSDAFAYQPLIAASYGLHQYDGKFLDFRRESLAAEAARLHAFKTRLAAFKPGELGAASTLDCHLLGLQTDYLLFQIEEAGTFTKNPMTYAGALDINVYLKRDFAPLADRLRSIVEVEKQVPAMFAVARENLAEILPEPMVKLAIAIATGGAKFLQHDLVDAVKEVKDEALLAEFKTVNDRAAKELTDYADWLKRERLPKADQSFALGEEKYRHMLLVNDALDIPPARILEIGMAELKREQAAFAEAAAVINPNKPAIEVFRDIQHDHPTAEGLLPDIRKNLEGIRGFLVRRGLIDIPSEVRATVAETPQYLRESTFASSDNPGPFEVVGAQAYYYVTPTETAWSEKEKDEWLTSFNHYTSDVVSIHEVYPGHYVQALRLNASPVSKVQKIVTSYAYIEGWAHYCEQMVLDEGYGEAASGGDAVGAAKFRLAQSDEALLRICRLCVSIKLHTQGMSVAEATKFFEDNCYYEHKPAGQEALRGTFDPGYLFYTVGKLELLKLRRDYQAQEGSAYSLKKFNDAITDHGQGPVRFLREILLKDAGKAREVL